MKFLVWAAILLCSALALAEGPPGYEEQIYLDRHFNLYDRDPLPDTGTERVYYFDLPYDSDSITESERIDGRTKSYVEVIHPDGKRYTRFYIADEPLTGFGALEVELHKAGIALHRVDGVRIQGHFTQYIWNAGQNIEPLIVKQRNTSVVEGKLETSNGYAQGSLGVKTNDVVEKIFDEASDGFISYLPEHFAASLRLGSVDFAFSTRLPQPVRKPPGDSLKMLPLHGFIGSTEKVHEAAVAWRKSHPTLWNRFQSLWKTPEHMWMEQVYIPRLARFYAESAFKYGVIPEAHGQNLLLQVDEKTGDIAGFVFRDMRDVMFNPLTRLAQGKELHLDSLTGLKVGRMNLHFVDAEWAKRLGGHADSYLSQSILVGKNGIENRRYAQLFLKGFNKHTNQIVGTKYGIDPWVPFPYGEDRAQNQEFAAYLNTLQANLERFVDGISDQAADTQLRRLQNQASKDFDQPLLKKLFERHAADQEVALGTKEAELRLYYRETHEIQSAITFFFDGHGIIAASREGPEAYVYGLTPEEIKRIRATGLAAREPSAPGEACPLPRI